MLGRFFLFLFWLGLGGAIGYGLGTFFSDKSAMFLGVIAAALVWMLVSAFLDQRMLRWLQSDRPGDFDVKLGVWAVVAARVQRLLRDRERESADRQSRLDSFLSAMQVSPNGVTLLDGDSHIEWCNDTAALHFGLDIERDKLQVIGNLVRDPGFVAYMAGKNYHNGFTMPGRNSSTVRPVTLSVQLHPYGEGRKLLLSRDITMVEQAEAMRRDFVANVSHEIRTPLTVLGGFVETLQTLELSDAERLGYLDLMAQQAERMQTLVSDLLTLSKLEGSPLPSMDTAVPIAPLMRQLEHDAKALSCAVAEDNEGTAQKISFTCEFDGSLLGARSELLSAMSNLVTNAVRYTPRDGHIDIKLAPSPTDGALVFSVSDTGPGIAKEHLGRLTERFYRVDRSRSRETGGTGLGLAIVKHVAQRHGTKLLIESTVGHGSVFSLTFPPQRVLQVKVSDAAGTPSERLFALLDAQ
jgi:two-component system phosphate regulon sensor histidine kinase PhoR